MNKPPLTDECCSIHLGLHRSQAYGEVEQSCITARRAQAQGIMLKTGLIDKTAEGSRQVHG